MIILKLLGSLALLMFGMKSMSEALQKMAGPQLRHVLGAMTTNRFTGVLTGMFVTAAVQSSTATTLMTVSFVNAGLLTLAQAISVIMGAHIGTTVTAWIMSLTDVFNVQNLVYPAFFAGIILIYMKKPVISTACSTTSTASTPNFKSRSMTECCLPTHNCGYTGNA